MRNTDIVGEELTSSVIAAFFAVYNTLGFGFLEHTYIQALELELSWRGHRVARQVAVPIFYKGVELSGQRLDMLVDDVLVVEVKATYQLSNVAQRQLFNYLCASGLPTGLLLHFGPQPQFFRRDNPRPRLVRKEPAK
jgi:GxxExxY protein